MGTSNGMRLGGNPRFLWRRRRVAVSAFALSLVVILGVATTNGPEVLSAGVWDSWYVADYAGSAPMAGQHTVAWSDASNNRLHLYSTASEAHYTVSIPGYDISSYINYSQPRVDGTGHVVFGAFNHATGVSDLFACDFTGVGNQTVVQVTNDAWSETLQQICYPYIVWQGEDRSTYPWKFGIFLYNLVDHSITKILDWKVYAEGLCTDGTYVVWSESTTGTDHIICYDIAGKGVMTISDTAEDCRGPQVAGGVIAWTAKKPGSPENIGVRVQDGNTQTKKYDNQGWVLDLSDNGNYVLYMEPSAIGWDIVCRNSRSGQMQARIALGPSDWSKTASVSDTGRIAYFDTNGDLAVHDVGSGTTVIVESRVSGLIGPVISSAAGALQDYVMWYTTTGQIHVGRGDIGATGMTSSTTTSSTTTTSTTTPGVSTTTSTSVPAGGGFSDVWPGRRYFDAIVDMASQGIINGYPDGTFRPDNLVLRKHFAKMIVGVVGLPVSEADWQDSNPPFIDCGPDDLTSVYPHDFIAVAKQYGLTQGKTALTFAPDTYITRAQLFTMVVRAAQNIGLQLDPVGAGYWSWGSLRDYNDPNHAANARLAEYNGLLNELVGTGSAASWMGGYATRGEVAQVLWNLMRLGAAAQPA